jgi:hypothetical protein
MAIQKRVIILATSFIILFGVLGVVVQAQFFNYQSPSKPTSQEVNFELQPKTIDPSVKIDSNQELLLPNFKKQHTRSSQTPQGTNEKFVSSHSHTTTSNQQVAHSSSIHSTHTSSSNSNSHSSNSRSSISQSSSTSSTESQETATGGTVQTSSRSTSNSYSSQTRSEHSDSSKKNKK